MIPEKGQQVKCYMRSGIVLEGTVVSWGNAEVILKLLDRNLMIIHRPTDDIMLTKVMIFEEPAESQDDEPKPEKPMPDAKGREDRIRKKLQEMQDSHDLDLQKKSVEELRQMILEEDRKMIAEKTKEHFGSISSPKMTQYSSPYTPKRHK
jgi:sRNA-binding regulator protein Hfq